MLKRIPDIFKVTLKIDTLSSMGASAEGVINCKKALKELNNINQACKSVPSVIEALKQALNDEDDQQAQLKTSSPT